MTSGAELQVEALVIGAGLAGSAAAATLARAGERVLLVERGEHPRDKLCGEFLSWESRALLERLEAWPEIHALQPHPIDRARFLSAGGREVELELPGTAHGLSRLRLDAVLFSHALRAGAEARTGSEAIALSAERERFRVELRDRNTGAVQVVWARRVIGAWGRRARLDRSLERSFLAAEAGFLGLKRHHRAPPELLAELDGVVEIYTTDGAYCGVSRVEGETVNVCLLLEQRALGERADGAWEPVLERLRRRHPGLEARMEALQPSGPPLAVAAIPFQHKGAAAGGVLFAGDAAEVIAPLVGDGQAMALESGVAVAELLCRAQSLDGPALAARWEREHRRRFGVRLALARRLQAQLLRGDRAELVFGVVGAVPGLAGVLARLSRAGAAS